MTDAVAVFVELVVNIEHGAAGVAKHGVDPLLHQTFHQDLRSR